MEDKKLKQAFLDYLKRTIKETSDKIEDDKYVEKRLLEMSSKIREMIKVLERSGSLYNDILDPLQKETERKKETFRHVLDKPIDQLGLSTRSYNCLSVIGIKSVGDLIKKTDYELLKTKNFGRKALSETKQALKKII